MDYFVAVAFAVDTHAQTATHLFSAYWSGSPKENQWGIIGVGCC